MEEVANDNWSGKTDGLPWMHKSLVVMMKAINIRVFYGIMGLAIPFYMLFSRRSYLSTYRYFRLRHKYSAMKSFWNVYKNHFVFGQIVLDRFAVYSGKTFDIKVEGLEHFNKLANGDSGFLMLSSHVGNYELAGYHLVSKTKTINALVFMGEVETVMENRRKMFAGKNINMIPVKSDMSHIFTINEALSAGNIVSIPSDRVFGSPRFVQCPFLGENAKFPIGPFAVAAQRDLPALAIFVMKESAKRYTIHVKRISNRPSEEPIRKKSAAMAQEYAGFLEDIIIKYPTQWFNYYNFWE